MSAATFKAAIPEPFRILGLKLRPLSLGRYRLLRRFDVAFVCEEPALPRPGDLVLGVYICSKRCDEFLSLLDSGDCWKEMEVWGNQIFKTGPWRKILPRRFQKPEPFDYLQKVNLFKRYLNESVEVPKYWDEESNNIGSGAHWSQSVELVLRGELGWGKDEIDEQPISKAISDYYKWLENKGAIRLMTANEIQMISDLEKAARN